MPSISRLVSSIFRLVLISSCHQALKPSNNKIMAMAECSWLFWSRSTFDHSSIWSPLMRSPTLLVLAAADFSDGQDYPSSTWVGSAGQGHPSPAKGPLVANWTCHHGADMRPIAVLRGSSTSHQIQDVGLIISHTRYVTFEPFDAAWLTSFIWISA